MRRFYPTFTQQQTAQLIALNRQLAKLEYSCLQRSRHLVEHYKALTGGTVDWEQGLDFELECTISYYRSLAPAEEQSESGSEDSLVLQAGFVTMPAFKWYFLNPTADRARSIFEHLYFNWYDGVEGIAGLKDERICWSFHDLHDHHRLTWEQILRIDSVAMDICAVHQLFVPLDRCKQPTAVGR